METGQGGPPRKDRLPFKYPLGEQLGTGRNSDAFSLGPDWVVKVKKDRRFVPNDWEKRFAEGQRLLEEYIPTYIPSTYLVRTEDTQSKNGVIIVQRAIHGQPLRDVSWDSLNEAGVRDQLNDMSERLLAMHDVTKRLPDLYGGRKILDRNLYSVKGSDNIIVDPAGQVWLRDTGMEQDFFNPNDIRGKLNMRFTRNGLVTFREQLNG